MQEFGESHVQKWLDDICDKYGYEMNLNYEQNVWEFHKNKPSRELLSKEPYEPCPI